MKLIIKLLLISSLGLITGLAQAQYIIKFSHVVSPNTPKGKAAELFAKLVDERLEGKVRVEIFPNSQLYNDNKVIEAMRLSDSKTTGIIAAPSLSKFVKFSKTLQAFDLPFLFHNINDVHKLTDSDVAKKMTDPLHKKGLRALAFLDNGMKVFSIKGDEPLRNAPDDFVGKKFRIQSSDVHAAMIKALGGTPQKLPFKEVYTALGQGVVDGQENAWSNVYSKKFHEVQDYITVSGHSYLGYLMVVSDRFWQNLPADIRGELEKIIAEVTITSREYAAQADTGDRKKVEQSGTAKVIELSEKEKKQWIKATRKVEDQFRDEIGAELLKEIHNLLGH